MIEECGISPQESIVLFYFHCGTNQLTIAHVSLWKAQEGNSGFLVLYLGFPLSYIYPIHIATILS